MAGAREPFGRGPSGLAWRNRDSASGLKASFEFASFRRRNDVNPASFYVVSMGKRRKLNPKAEIRRPKSRTKVKGEKRESGNGGLNPKTEIRNPEKIRRPRTDTDF
jgi:hypothetical protein